MLSPYEHARAQAEALRKLLPHTKAAADVLKERTRQINAEGWTLAHDDAHAGAQMAFAAAAYAYHAAAFRDAGEQGAAYQLRAHPGWWPWARNWWKPKDPRRDLVRAAALIIAEIERLDRSAAARTASGEAPEGSVDG